MCGGGEYPIKAKRGGGLHFSFLKAFFEILSQKRHMKREEEDVGIYFSHTFNSAETFA